MAAPVEYAVAAEHYLRDAPLSAASRRVYRISLASWAWVLTGQQVPAGVHRRGAVPPALPLALLDGDDAPARLAAAADQRLLATDARTVNRELSALRSAVGWWREQGWISQDPAAGLRNLTATTRTGRALSPGQVSAVLRLPATLREHAFWRVLHDSGTAAGQVLGISASSIDLAGACARTAAGDWIRWRPDTSEVIGWLLAGRRDGPVFLTSRRAPASAAREDVCPVTGRARLSYRHAAEIFTASTRPLDPAGRGWTLGQLRMASRRPGPFVAASN